LREVGSKKGKEGKKNKKELFAPSPTFALFVSNSAPLAQVKKMGEPKPAPPSRANRSMEVRK
jgi:hypothetical protein